MWLLVFIGLFQSARKWVVLLALHSKVNFIRVQTEFIASSISESFLNFLVFSLEDMLEEYNVELKGPYNYSARDEAGIPRQWYDTLFS